jgi:SpoIID/LytB domain protein
MPHGFPLEALKAQAVAARSEAVSKMGKAHLSDPFDLCADVDCQVYSGLSKRTRMTDYAVRETQGLVLWKSGVCNAVYSAVCGGHTEHTNNTWGGDHLSYLTGKYDGTGSIKQYGDLSQESRAKRWIDSNPSAFCNTTRGKVLPSMEYTRKYFRWEKILSQEELQNSLKSQTGKDVGAVLDLVPLNRGQSGRIIRLQVRGSSEDLILDRELTIRKALASNTLWSSCFYVTIRGGNSGSPREFVLKGAGFGHGVGMCQTGAASMALKGARYDQILKHYYHGVKLKKLY